ncbi:MAG: tyrosine-type recombinase/integrase [Ignavibacteriales bacterium]|nr:tyrosine-type recombinase/integrase [Ignavibacteriales bacterium]
MYIFKDNKSPYYQLVYFFEGKRKTISTKTKNEKEATRFQKSFKLPIPKPEQKPVYVTITLSEFQQEYLNYVQATKSKHYIRSVQTSFRLLHAYTGEIHLDRLDLRTLDKFITATFKRAPRSASLYYRTLKAALSKAVLWDYLSENALKKIRSPKVSKVFPIFISETELSIILVNTKEGYLKDLFTIAFYTGMRLSEILNMKWSWVNFKENYIIVKCSEEFTTKSKNERIIPFNSNLQAILTTRFPRVINIKNEEYVFSKCPGIKFNENFISKKFKALVRIARLDEKVHFHTLRHSFASLLVQKGVSLYVVKELLGHESLTTTQIYSHLQQQNLRDAVNLFL